MTTRSSPRSEQLRSPVWPGEILGGLTEEQRRAVVTDASPLCILAGAGTGKTRVLTRRIAYRIGSGQATAEHVLALTFTRKAAGELGDRLRALGHREHLAAGTFHAVASAQLRRWWADRGRTPPVLLESPSRLIGALASERPGLRGVPVGELAAQLAWARARLITSATFEDAVAGEQRSGAPAAEVAGLFARYEHEKRRRGLVDFDDLLGQCADALESDQRFAAAQRWRWRHLFVDEFQDVNPLQHRLLLAWLGPESDLCVVGDPNQAIYGWNGADPRLLDQVPVRWPTTEVVRLEENHRCSPQVVAAGRAVLGPAGVGLRSRRPGGPLPTVRAYSSDTEEAAGVAAGVRRAHAEGIPWSRMAVLIRTNAQAGILRRAMEEAGIPCPATDRRQLLADPVVMEVIADLRRRSGMPVAVAVADLVEAAREVAEASEAAGRPGHTRDGGGHLAALSDLARCHADLDDRATIGGFLAWLPTAVAGDGGRAESDDCVTISSFHRAKGLEWAAVWICGLERGLVPIGPPTDPGREAEERRLLYVAVTRAERHLHCSWASRRTFGAHAVPRQPSPWLASIGDDGRPAARSEPLDVETWRARVDEQRRMLEKSGSPLGPGTRGRRGDRLACPDPQTVDRLRAWRADGARAAGLPAHVLLHDRTLEALATLRPSSGDELLRVPGLGPVKAARFGEVLLALVAGGARQSPLPLGAP